MLFSSVNLDNSYCIERLVKTLPSGLYLRLSVYIHQGRELNTCIQYSGSPEPTLDASINSLTLSIYIDPPLRLGN